MSVEELVKLYRTSPLIRDNEVADKLEELAAKASDWEERFWKCDAQSDRLMQERDKAEAALAEAKRENEALREKAHNWSMEADKYKRALDRYLARNAGGKDADR